jgi:hypothetical protein
LKHTSTQTMQRHRQMMWDTNMWKVMSVELRTH